MQTEKKLILDTIRTRRNIREFTNEHVPESALKVIIEAATWAPNHRNTEPWRFIVLTKEGDMRKKVADIIKDWVYQNVKNPNPERRIANSKAAMQEILDAARSCELSVADIRTDEVELEDIFLQLTSGSKDEAD